MIMTMAPPPGDHGPMSLSRETSHMGYGGPCEAYGGLAMPQ